jgi:hypothetical protein
MTDHALKLGLSRRVVCASGFGIAALACAPSFAAARHVVREDVPARAISPALELRGVQIGGHAVLRLTGTVTTSVGQAWRFAENTQVQWRLGYDQTIIEQRVGRLQLTPPASGKLIEVATGPFEEILPLASADYALARHRGVDSLVQASQPIAVSDIWAIIDNPMAAPLPLDVSGFRVFRREANAGLRVFSAMRSPWLPALGENQHAPVLTWRAAGTLTAWQREDLVRNV